MDSTTLFISFAGAMWLLQIILGWQQLQAFNRAFWQLSQKGRVSVGRNSGRFRAKAVVVLAFDEEQNVVDGFYLQGFSVFARPKRFEEVIGLKLNEIVPEQLFPQDKKRQEALKIALSYLHCESKNRA